VDPERAETYLRMLAEAELRRAATDAAAVRPTERVRRAAGILVEVGALGEDLADEVITGIETALALRARADGQPPARKIRRLTNFPHKGPGAFPHRSPASPGRAQARRDDQWRVIPVGRTLRFREPPVGADLMTLVLTPDRIIAPVTIHTGAAGAGPGMLPFGALTAADDRGTSYHVEWSISGGGGITWEGLIILDPSPPPDASWLDLLTGPGERLLRVDLSAPPPVAAGATALVSQDSPGEQLLNGMADAMLAKLVWDSPAAGMRLEWDYTEAGLRDMVAALEAAGALSPLSPVPARLAALGRQLSMADPEAAEGGTGVAGSRIAVPERWTSVLAYYGRRHRPAPWTGTAALSALLPELGGVRFAVAGLHGALDGTVLYVVARGLAAPWRATRLGLAWSAEFSWWLSDGAGRWHLAALDGLDVNGTDAALRLALWPPLRRDAAALTLHVTGRGNRVTTALPFSG
jgi:hypothetical protein